jgi:surface protein
MGKKMFMRVFRTSSFTMQVKTDNTGASADNQFTIPADTGTYTYDYDVTTSDGQIINGNTGSLTITFPSGAGIYEVNISRVYPYINMNDSGDKEKLTSIEQWGNIVWSSFANSFSSCQFLETVKKSTPDLSNVTKLNAMFQTTSNITTVDVSNWDVSNITDFNGMFNISGVTEIKGLDTWVLNTNENISLQSLLRNCSALSLPNGVFDNWDTSKVTNIREMLRFVAYDGSFANWDISNITNFINFMVGSAGISTVNYDATLISWAGQSPSINESVSFGGAKYTLGGAAEAARDTLVNTYGWTITDGGGI